MSHPAVALSGLSKTYTTRARRRRTTRRALDNVTLAFEPGTVVALMGPNGSGKSTLLRIVAGLSGASAGQATIGGERAGTAEARRRIAMVFQDPAVDELLSVGENLELQAALYGMKGADSERACREAAASMGVDDRWNDRVGTLSGGLRRRVELARAVLTGPGVLLMDEPESGLDIESRDVLLETARRVADDGACVVLATHNAPMAEACDRVVMLAEGRVVRDGEPHALRAELGTSVASLDEADVDAGDLERFDARGRACFAGPTDAVRSLADRVVDAGGAVSVEPVTLEHVYLHAVSSGAGGAS